MLLELLDSFYFIGQVTILPMMGILAVWILRKGFNKYQIILCFPFILISITTFFFPYLARENIKNVLDENVLIFEVSGPINEDIALKELKSLHFILSENSHPVGEKIPIKIVTDKSRKHLSIYRDYLRKGKYWLFDEDYKYSQNNSIGYIIIKD
ncbi:hypothetical protein [Vibrio coralliilyticus]|uniref:hypothetical protein n=1 Tax=Vibrio coralliilyticus TaxID=190893 RepID=UPI0015619A29|nr:hypothetical protein [Vibrio coralliilyticus]NRF28262.1 hypothetical protein [Vibrio coralliilyticus]NRF51927.1 hypothetical protein [Vibrio coralliilyticus]